MYSLQLKWLKQTNAKNLLIQKFLKISFYGENTVPFKKILIIIRIIKNKKILISR